jgi:alpha-tubulin suppressor-like RCC1 family protein
VCDPELDDCVAECTAGCLVQGVCYAPDSTNPATPCFVCDPAQSTSALSPRDAGTACGEGITQCAASTCNGEGSCVTVLSPTDVLCGGTGICREPDHCDGDGECAAGEALPLGTECGSNRACSGDENAPACTCVEGYEPSANGCVDIDECAEGLDDCDEMPEACVNTPGGFDCQCTAPYVGDGVGIEGCYCEREDYSVLCEPWTHVSTSNLSTCAISAGALFCWGDNESGQLAIGDQLQSSVPVRVGSAQDWEFVAMGYDHACGIRAGELYCWGNPVNGALGHDDWGDFPARVGTAVDWSTVTAGVYSTCGIRGEGDLYCWGSNSYGQVGVGSATPSFEKPQFVMDGVTSMAANSWHVCAIRAGRLYCWGDNDGAQLLPTLFSEFEDWTRVDVDLWGGCAVRAGGALYCWGLETDLVPELVPGRDDWTHVSAEFEHYCGLTEGGQAYCWGPNWDGQLGDGTTTLSDVPVPVQETGEWQRVESGHDFSFGIRDGGLYAWGSNKLGRRGTGFVRGRVGNAADWLAVSVTSSYGCGLREPGDLYCWGKRPVPVAQPGVARVGTESGWTRITAGWLRACGIRQGALYCFGWNGDGQLGDGTFTDATDPVQVGTASNWVDLSMESDSGHTCAVNADGELACWGHNEYGQLGDGTTENRTTPHPVAGVGWTSVSTGDGFTCGVLNGELYCWGDPSSLKLGTSAPAIQTTPLRVGTSSGWTSVSTGAYSACGLLAGTPYCWGSNSWGQIGIGETSLSEYTPTAVSVAGTFTRIESGPFVNCAVSSAGALYCWGSNEYGQLGTGDFTSRNTPALVPGPSGWQEISNDGGSSCGIREGALYCWGSNTNGALGTGEGLSPMPVENGL